MFKKMPRNQNLVTFVLMAATCGYMALRSSYFGDTKSFHEYIAPQFAQKHAPARVDGTGAELEAFLRGRPDFPHLVP